MGTHFYSPQSIPGFCARGQNQTRAMGKNHPLPSTNLCQLNSHVLISFVSQGLPPAAAALGSLPAMAWGSAGTVFHWHAQARALLITGQWELQGSSASGKWIQAKSNFKKTTFNLNSYLLSL